MGNSILRKEPDFLELLVAEAKIAFLISDKEMTKNRKIVYADCRKVAEQYRWCCDYDFMITVYEPNVFNFTTQQLRILLEHELRHCGVDNEGNETTFYLIPHDVEEFYPIIEKYGIDWDA